MFTLTKPWHWIGVATHNVLVKAIGFESELVRNRATIEADEQKIADAGCLVAGAINPMWGLVLMRVLPGFSASFAKVLDALPDLSKMKAPSTITLTIDADFLEHVEQARATLEAMHPGSTVPPAAFLQLIGATAAKNAVALPAPAQSSASVSLSPLPTL